MILKHLLVNVYWLHPSFKEEIDEFKRTANEKNIPLEDLKLAFKNGKPITLTNDVWKKMKNTDSWKTDTMAKVEVLADKYGKDLKSIMSTSKLPMPIVLKNKNEYYLIAGNTRLMYCKANKIVPEIFLITL